MTGALLTKLKIQLKRLVGKCVYIYVYLKNSIITIHKKNKDPKEKNKRKHKNTILNFLAIFSERWRTFTFGILGFLMIYYGLGATVSSTINNQLDYTLQTTQESPRHTTEALSYVLKSQIDDTPWTPALPIIFPAAVLDNLPNFQLGAKESAKYLIKRLAGYHTDNNLKEAGELLDYPADIWLFSQTADDKLAPGSAKQYRKAIAKLSDFATSENNNKATGIHEFLYILSGAENLIDRRLNTLHQHVLEHNSEILDFRADDVFYQTEGYIYTIYYILEGLAKDYQDIIVETGQYENLTSALSFLRAASELNPLSVKNASPQDTFEANHLLYLGYYLSRAQNYLKTIHNNIELYSRK